MTKAHFVMIALMSLGVAGCESRNPPANASAGTRSPSGKSSPAPSVADSVTAGWMGKWIGPEGTYLVLSQSGQKYVVEIHSLDGAASYDGTPDGDRIEFQRNGKTEFLHAGSGQDTGMKWLLDKKNCLIIQTGEGFCRD